MSDHEDENSIVPTVPIHRVSKTEKKVMSDNKIGPSSEENRGSIYEDARQHSRVTGNRLEHLAQVLGLNMNSPTKAASELSQK